MTLCALTLATYLFPALCGRAENVVALGDSITYGYLVTTPWPSTIFARMSPGVQRLTNAGVVGDTSAQMLTRWTSTYRSAAGYNMVIVLGGVNDIRAGTSGAATFANLKTIYDQAIADGKRLIRCTVIGFKGEGANWTAGKQTELDALNASITAYAGGGQLIDFYNLMGDTDPRFLKAAYDTGDGLHPNQAGDDKMADIGVAAIQAYP